MTMVTLLIYLAASLHHIVALPDMVTCRAVMVQMGADLHYLTGGESVHLECREERR
jgi:hypothetical protein